MVEEKLNFSQISALIVDADRYSTSILSQILRGFGLTRLTVSDSGTDAKRLLQAGGFDLVICECVLPDMAAAEFVRWIRRLGNPAVRYVPVVMLTGYAQLSNVTAARDSGANSVVRKPVAPSVLYDHISWSARAERPFVEGKGYSGPCRRFKFVAPPPGAGRRDSDQVAEIGAPNQTVASVENTNPIVEPEKAIAG